MNTPSFQDLEILIFIPVLETTGYTTFPLRGSFHVCCDEPLFFKAGESQLECINLSEQVCISLSERYSHGPVKLRGKEISNLVLLNVFRIIAGYRRISHLSNNRDHSVALASGIGMYGSTSKYYEDTINFEFAQIHKLRCDLVARAKELGLIEGLQIGFDFHFREMEKNNHPKQSFLFPPHRSTSA